MQLWHGELESAWEYHKHVSRNSRAARDASRGDRFRRNLSKESRSSTATSKLTLTRTHSSHSLAKSIQAKFSHVLDDKLSLRASEEASTAQDHAGLTSRSITQAKPQEKANWLVDRPMLPVSLPNSRILAFGFRPLDHMNQSPSFRFKYFAKKLLETLRNDKERQKCPTRPTILIGHHLGGIVVERALVKAKRIKGGVDTFLSSI